jgi:hypothetical protein
LDNHNIIRMKKSFKSIGAVLAGLITIIFLSNGTDMILEATGIFPSVEEQRLHGFMTTWMVGLALFYRLVYLIVGGYVTAALAPVKAMNHVIVLGSIGTLLGILGAIATWGFAPGWFLVTPTVLGIPSVWIGGKLRIRTSMSDTTISI